MRPFSFPKPVLFKEWVQQRNYLLASVLFLSIDPAMRFVQVRSQTGQFLRMWVSGMDMPGLGYLMIVVPVGLALMSLAEVYRDGGLALATQPFPASAVIRTKFLVGAIGVIGAQVLASTWVDVVLVCRHSWGSYVVLLGYFLQAAVFEVTFYAVAFALILNLRPTVLAVLLTLVLLDASQLLAVWLLPGAPAALFNTVLDMSPYGIIHMGDGMLLSLPVGLRVLQPLLWLLPAITLVGRYHAVTVEVSAAPITRFPGWLRSLCTLGIAVILYKYLVERSFGMAVPVRLAMIAFLWLCTHLLVRAVLERLTLGRVPRTRRHASQNGGARG